MKAENARFDYSKELQIENKKSVVKEKKESAVHRSGVKGNLSPARTLVA